MIAEEAGDISRFLKNNTFHTQKENKTMKKFNQMTEAQMSQVDGGIALAVVGLVTGIVGAVCGIVSATCNVFNAVKGK